MTSTDAFTGTYAGIDDLTVTLDGGVLAVTLNRPDSLNSLTAPMLDTFADALEKAATDPRVRPTAAAMSADAPPSGINPILVKASMKKALSEASTTSHASASDTPTPAAGPCTTDTAGWGRLTIARMQRLAASSTSAGVPAAPGLA